MNTYAYASRGVGLILIAALLWGTVGVATKAIYTIADTTALSVGFLRLAIATPVLLVACWHTCGRHAFRISPRDLPLMLLIGVTMALYQVCFLGAIPRIGVASTTLITLCTAPVIVALLAAALLGEVLTSRVVLALVAGLVGTVMLSWTNPEALAGRHTTVVGVGLAVSSALSYSIMTLCSRALAGRYHPLQPMTVGLGAGALLLLPFALVSGITVSFPPAGWGLLLYLGIVPTALAFVVFLMGMEYTTATVASIITLIEPLTATMLAWLLFDEQLGLLGLLGAALLLGAIGLLYLGSRQQVRRSSRERTQPDLDSL
ncbi:MAG TPA: EamA family transporter [Herpetosiphonaceae bacterium]